MRMRRLAIIVGAVVLVLPLSALVPIWATTRASPSVSEDAARLVPPDLSRLLIEECQGVIPLADDETLIPNWVDDRVWLELYRVDKDGSISRIPPTDAEAAAIAEANDCLAAYTIEKWRDPPVFDAFHRNMYYDYLAVGLVPCLVAQGIDARVPSREAFKTLDEHTWYRARMVGLELDEALRAWRACPPIPEYLVSAGLPIDPVEFLRP